jgi:hypothetical protein
LLVLYSLSGGGGSFTLSGGRGGGGGSGVTLILFLSGRCGGGGSSTLSDGSGGIVDDGGFTLNRSGGLQSIGRFSGVQRYSVVVQGGVLGRLASS